MGQEIQCRSLTGKNRARISLDLRDLRAGFHKRPIVVGKRDYHLRIKRAKNSFGNRQSGANERLPRENVSAGRRSQRNHCLRRRVSRAHILFQRTPYNVSNVFGIPVHKAPKNYASPSSCDSRSCNLRSSILCSASVASNPLMIVSGARLRNISSPSCLSFDATAFCKPAISFFSRVFSATTSTLSEYAIRTSKSEVDRTTPPSCGSCSAETVKSDNIASRKIPSRLRANSSRMSLWELYTSAATFFRESSFNSARIFL